MRPGLARLRSLWRNIVHRGRVEQDLDDELRSAFETLVKEYIGTGMQPTEARRAATLELGRIDSIKTQVREARTGAGLQTVWQDVTFGARLLRRNPLFSLTAILSLGIGIGANAAIFSIVNVLMLRDLPVADPWQLVEVGRVTRRGPGFSFSYPAYERLRDRNAVFSGLMALSRETIEGRVDGGTSAPAGRYVSGNLFETLRVSPLAGRLLSPQDDRVEAPRESAVAVIAHRFWQREFGGSAAAIGRTVRVDAIRFTIVGVLPASFEDLIVGRAADFFVPIASEALVEHDSQLRDGSSSWLGIAGRLKPGIPMPLVQANLEPILSAFLVDMAADIPDARVREAITSQRLILQSARRGLSDVRENFSRPVLLLMGAVSLVLVVACANVIALLLARGVTRRREMALRLAIGATRERLIRQLLTESALLGVVSTVLGLGIAALGAPLLVRTLSQDSSPLRLDVAPDGRVLLFTAAVAIASALLAGVLPAFRAARNEFRPGAHGDARSGLVTRESSRWGQALIAVQVALSLLLVVAATLLTTTLRNIRGVHPGFDAERVLLLKLDPGRVGYTGPRLMQYYRDVLARVRATPGVQHASLSRITPISGSGSERPITLPGRERGRDDIVSANRMSEGFFATMAIPVLLGRDFGPADGGGAVAIVNDALARRYFKDDNPIGRRIELGDRRPLEIIGVVANAKYYSLRDGDTPTAYIYSLDSGDPGGLTLAVRTAGDAPALAATIHGQVESVASAVPVSQPRALSTQVERSLMTERLVARLLGLFAVLALALASAGLYGVLGYSVARRTSEIGLRLALGATRGAVLRSVLGQAVLVVAIGSAIGVPATMVLSRPLGSLLYGVTASDPTVLAAAVACLLLVAVAAAAVPAWRAARVDPLVALRHE
jgi:predicted permease